MTEQPLTDAEIEEMEARCKRRVPRVISDHNGDPCVIDDPEFEDAARSDMPRLIAEIRTQRKALREITNTKRAYQCRRLAHQALGAALPREDGRDG